MTTAHLDLDKLEAEVRTFERLSGANSKALIAECKRLREENFALAANQCGYPSGDDYGNHRCAEIDRLRKVVVEQGLEIKRAQEQLAALAMTYVEPKYAK